MRRLPDLIHIFTFSLVCLLATSIQAQRSLIRTYTVGDGLVMNRVRGFHQDKDGFIWMYTWDGLSRYEGYRFRNYIAGRDLQHSFVNDIYELPDGTLYLPLNDSSMAVMRNQEIQPEILMPRDVINHFYKDDNGKIFVATDSIGICEFDNGKLLPLTSSLPVRSIQKIIRIKDHTFFIGPYSGPSGVFDRNWNLISAWQGPPGFYNSIYKDHRERIFVATIEGLREVDLSSTAFELKEVADMPKDARWKKWNVSSVIVTPENDMWIGTSQGLVHFRSDQSWSVLTVQDGLLSNQVSSLYLDRSNTLWIGTDAGAASINLQTKIFDNRNLPGVVSNFVLPAQDGSVYAISGNTYLCHVDKQMKIVRSANISKPHNLPIGLIPRHNKMMVIRQMFIEELNHELFPFQQPGAENPGHIYVMQHDKYWISTDFGFFCANYPGMFYRNDNPTFLATSLIPARNDHLIIGTLQNGVFLVRPEDIANACTVQKVRDFSPWTDDPRIRSLMVSKNGDLWIGTRFSGVVRLRCNDDYSNCTKQSYSISNGLVSNWITSITEDQYGNVWIGSASGIDKLIRRDDAYYVFAFSRVNGYYTNVRQLVVHPDGSLWVGHSEGLSRITDGRIDTIGPPATYITEASLGGNDYPTFPVTPVSLRYDQNSAHFAFASPDFINSSQLMFTYRLLGSKDTSWSQPVKTNEIFYGNLNPGKFRFEVATFGWNGERSVPVSYAFEILNPFWKQTWFIILSILLIGMAVFALYRFRISQMQQVQTVRDRIAADLHDEIGSSLTHINILSEIGKQHHVEGNGASNIFERIGTEVQTSAEALDDIIWSVKTQRDAIGDIIARMRQYATEIFEPAGIEFQLHEHVEGIQSLEMEFKRDFYLVYKEILRNILRHAEATNIDIHINVDRSRVYMQITDNGKGFDINAPTDRSGLSNIHARVKKWTGRVLWDSTHGEGTQVTVVMKPG